MEIKKIQCDVCGGKITIQKGGKFGTCEYCGTQYTIERMREIYDGMKVSVTGTVEDVKQWKMLLERYMDNCDYQAALSIVRKILEAVPDDYQAITIYQSLQELKFFDIRNGVLAKYTGKAEIVIIPRGIKKIGKDAFNGSPIKEVILSDSVEEIDSFAFGYLANSHASRPDWLNIQFVSPLQKISFGSGLRIIKEYAFHACDNLKELYLPDNIEEIQKDSMPFRVENLRMPSNYKGSAECCYHCFKLENVEASSEFIENLRKLQVRNEYDIAEYWDSPFHIKWIEEKMEQERIVNQRKNQGKCLYCGGKFKGLMKKVCLNCGREKNY